MYSKILLATDGSDYALRAAENAVFLAGVSKVSEMVILYIVDSLTSKTDVLEIGNKEVIVEKRRLKLKSTEKIVEDKNIDFSTKILRGDPGPTIIEYANKNSFDLVVIGSRGLNTVQQLILGSVSHKVAKRVYCPVLIVK